MSIEIRCVKTEVEKLSGNVVITQVGGEWGTLSAADAINQIKHGFQCFHVRIGWRNFKVIVETVDGRECLALERDKFKSEELGSLPTCSEVFP